MSLLHSGESEGVKLTVHAASGALALVCFSYNLLAWCVRRERHLAVNIALYGTIAVIESRKVLHHHRSWSG